MWDYQHQLFVSVTYWPLSTSLALFGLGALFNLQGFRFARFLFGIAAAGVGFAVGGALGQVLEMPPMPVAIGLGLCLGIVSLARLAAGVTICSIATLCFYSGYLAIRMGFSEPNILIAAATGAFVGGALAWVGQRSLPILISTLQGAALMLVGFIGISAELAPTFASTFVGWARELSLMVPLLLVMLVVLGYSVQANMQQGDIRNGTPGATDWKGRDARA